MFPAVSKGMSLNLPIVDHGPEKPAFGETCNGCGFCCAAEVCKLGKHIHGDAQEAPCPSLVFQNGRFWCGAVLAADSMGLGPALRFSLGIGAGCDAE